MNNDAVIIGGSHSGPDYASYAGVHLNSPYDPLREADRFLASRHLTSAASTIVILGDTLPYLRNALHKRFPSSSVISLYLHGDFPLHTDGRSTCPSAEDYWSPASGRTLRDYLAHRLAPVDLDGLTVLQWPPSLRAFPELANEVSRTLEQVVREGTGDWVTAAAFARTWVHNMLANFLTLDRWYALEPHDRPVVVAASGPTLALSLEEIARYRRRLALVALPSSLHALAAAGLSPDLLVTIDAGYWAQLHLRGLHPDAPIPVALPLTASRGMWRSPARPVILSAGSFFERELFRHAGFGPADILPTATVSAAALELSSRWSAGPVLVAGLDLSYERLEEHVRPHPFDALFETTATRTRPHLSVMTERLLLQGLDRADGSPAMTPALKTYAGWFHTWKGARPAYRLHPSRVALPGFVPLDSIGTVVDAYADADPLRLPPPVPTPSTEERRKTVGSLLDSWAATLSSAARILASAEADRSPGAQQTALDLLSNLSPRGYLHYRRMNRSRPKEASRSAKRLIDEAQDEIAGLKRRFLS